MIAHLRGTVTDKLDQYIVIECAGIGHGIHTSNETYGRLETSKEAKLYIYEHIREESHDLYGFISVNDKRFFEKLLSVNGVGPRMALAIVNLGTADEVSAAIAGENTAYLLRASGVGRRLAERIIVDLKNAFADAVLVARVGKAADNEALQALLALGYSQSQAVEALAQVEAKGTEAQVKEALRVLGR